MCYRSNTPIWTKHQDYFLNQIFIYLWLYMLCRLEKLSAFRLLCRKSLQNNNMKPRKFYFNQSAFSGHAYQVEWKNGQLGLRQSPCIIHDFDEVETIVKPSDEDWSNFEKSVKSLHMIPVDHNDMICDGTWVEVWITFRRRLAKFSMTNPEFKGYTQFLGLVNELTVCPEYPRGLFKFDPYEISQAHEISL